MPTRPTYPGVYIEEVPSGVRTIIGVSTSVTAFIGHFLRGPVNEPVQIFNWGDFEREFGGLDTASEASYAIQQFFLNGGGEAWIVRTAEDPKKAAVDLLDKVTGGSTVLTAWASSAGAWGDNLRLDVDHVTTTPEDAKSFNLTVSEVATVNGQLQIMRTETFRNLSTEETSSSFVDDVIEAGSKLLTTVTSAGVNRPTVTGTIGGDISALPDIATSKKLEVTLGSGTPFTGFALAAKPTTHEELRAMLQTGIRGLSGLEQATVELMDIEPSDGTAKEKRLRIKAGGTDPSAILTFGGTMAAPLKLDTTNASANVQQYALGGGTTAAQKFGDGGTSAQKGSCTAPTATKLIGEENDKTGIYALKTVDIFNLLCIPRTRILEKDKAADVMTKAIAFCDEERAFFLVDFPNQSGACDEPTEIKDWLSENATLRHRNAALYYPCPQIADPLSDYRLRAIGPSGTIAGLYARTDGERGVWKAPAGTDATLRGVRKLEYKLTDDENGALNPLGINCLRTFPIYGTISWGARTLRGADQLADEYKYVPIRRLALFLEESLFRGTQWCVFEPNDEPLWAQIRLNVGAFMHNLFRKGAFQGTTPRDAYFVKCDGETTTQSDRNEGIVNILVGFAPLKPAEFVIIKISQIAGEIQT